MLDAFHRWRCTFDWEVMGVHENAMHLLVGQKKLDESKGTNVLHKIIKSDMAVTMEAIKEYLTSHPELIANVIANSMYAQCDADGNEYLLLDLLVYYHKDDKVISLTDRRLVYGPVQ